jgi:hypothetical protein
MEEYTIHCVKNERNELAWFKTGISKLREVRKGFYEGRYPLCSEDKDPVYIPLKYSQKKKQKGRTFEYKMAYG